MKGLESSRNPLCGLLVRKDASQTNCNLVEPQLGSIMTYMSLVHFEFPSS